MKLHGLSETGVGCADELTGARPTALVNTTRAGIAYAVAAYGLWGVFPVYFKAVRTVPAFEVLAHRIIWSAAVLFLLLVLRREMGSVLAAIRDRRTVLTLAVTTCLITFNWVTFIWAVANNYLLQVSLGYFINPLISVLLGMVFLRERLRPWQWASVLLAAGGVAYLAVGLGEFPGIGLLLACSFGLYGLLRKTALVNALDGLMIETALLTPLATAFLAWEMWHGRAVFLAGSVRMDALLLAAGVVTATPLLWFAQAARRLRLSTLGFLQYLAPTGHFLLAVFAYGEPFTSTHLLAFGAIWTALLIYSLDAALCRRALVPASLPE
jgi:chloramphenicol-sensitive protein RarD